MDFSGSFSYLDFSLKNQKELNCLLFQVALQDSWENVPYPPPSTPPKKQSTIVFDEGQCMYIIYYKSSNMIDEKYLSILLQAFLDQDPDQKNVCVLLRE